MNQPFIKKNKVHAFGGGLELTLEDHIKYPLYSWPPTPVTYSVDFTGAGAKADGLALRLGERQIPFQLSNIRCGAGGELMSADVVFITDLPSGGRRTFRLEKGTPAVFESPVAIDEAADGIVMSGVRIGVKLPASCENPVEPAGPVMALRDAKGWVGRSRLSAGGRKVTQIKTSVTESGAVFARCRVEYAFEGGGGYRADVGVYDSLDFITLDEQAEGIAAEEHIFWRLDLTGFEPTHRFAPNNPGRLPDDPAPRTFEEVPWHKIDEPFAESFTHPMDLPTAGEHGELPFRLNVFETQNAASRNKNACFWDERSGRSVGIFLRRSENWDNGRYDIFTSWDGSAVRYYYEDGMLWWRFPVAAGTRSLGLTAYPHEKDRESFAYVVEKLKGFDGFPAPKLGLFAVTYTNFLENWHNTLNLDKVKEYTLTYPKGAARPAKICSGPAFESPEAMLEHLFSYLLAPSLPLYGASVNCGFSGVPYRRMSGQYFSTYNMIYDRFGDAQREQTEAILLLLAYLAQGECCVPMFVMHGGPPNLLSDVKRCLATTACLFPEHPDAEFFLQTFDQLIPLTSKFMTRPPLNQFMLCGGRWAENLGLYTWAYLQNTLAAHSVARILGGRRNTACTRETGLLGQWLVYSLTAPFGGDNPQTLALHCQNNRYWGDGCWPEGEKSRRLHPPQGAHSARRSPPNAMWQLALALERFAPLTAENLRYVSRPDDTEAETRGRGNLFEALSLREKRDAGTRPEWKTCAFTGYGVILRGAVGTPGEVSVHLQQIDDGSNYRWGTAGMGGNGAVYYYAAGKAYSHNGSEEIGDGMFHDCDAGCMLGVWKGYKYRSIGPNVMTNGYFDMGGFQFARIDAEVSPDSYAWPEYQSRSVTLSHSDYILLFDAVGSAHTKTRFAWSVALHDEFPEIQILTKTDNRWELSTPESKSVWYHGMGDSVALVTHKAGLKAEYRDGCAVVRREGEWTDYILRSQKTVSINVDGITFRGTSGAVRVNADSTYSLALFDGSLLAYGELTIEAEGEKPVAVSFDEFLPYTIEGRVVSLADARVRVTKEGGGELYIDGAKAAADERGFVFVPKGEHKLSLTQAGHRPVPAAPRITRIATGSGRARVEWTAVQSAEKYEIETSIDGGIGWSHTAFSDASPHELTGLKNETKYHFRVTALNAENRGAPSHEYPAYIGNEVPLPPDGLTLKFTADGELFTWGKILGACAYALYARGPNGDFRLLYRGEEREFLYQKTGAAVEQFAVAAVNLNGEGGLSEPVDDDSESLANWAPPKEGFDRNTLYNHHPFYAFNIHQFKPSPRPYPSDE